MAQYRYTTKNMDGKTLRGTMEASGESALFQQLREQGLFLIEAKDTTGEKKRRKLSSKQLQEFCKELSALLMAGVTIVRALEIITGEEGISGSARAVYQEILTELKKGVSLSEAMEQQECFPQLMLGMVRSGEGNGNIDRVMERLSLHYEKENRLHHQVRAALTYPIILLVMCAAVVVLIVTFILPQFEELFSEMESLPAVTESLMAFSDFLVQKWYLLPVLVLVLVVLVRTILKIPAVRLQVDTWKVHLPIAGKLNKVIYTARFSRTLSSLYSSGMPIVGALLTAKETIGNVYVANQLEQVASMVRSGVPLSQALREVDGFLNKLSGTIFVGEESGRLDDMLDSIAVTMETEAEEATKRLMTMLEPILICLMALIVGYIIVAVMLPIYQSYEAIERS